MYIKNNKFNKPQLVVTYSGIFELEKKTILIFVDEEMKKDLRRNNVIDMFQPLIVIDFNDTTINSNIKSFFNNLNKLLSVYNPVYNVIICVENTILLKHMMNYGYGRKEALLTGTTFEINMQEEWKKKQGIFKTNQFLDS